MGGSTVGSRSVVPCTLEKSYDATVTAALPQTALGLVGVSLGLAAEAALTLTGTERLVAVSVAAGVAVLLGFLALATHRRPIPAGLGHPLMTTALLATAAEPVTLLVLAGEPSQSLALLLIAAASGVLLLSLRWLVAFLYLAWGAWTASALAVGSSREWVHYAIGLAIATALAAAASHTRRTAVRELTATVTAAEAAAVRDQLTGLANRRGLAMVGRQILEHARRQGDAAHCVFVQVDGLRDVNEQLGNDAGDELIVSVGEALREVTRATDVVARWSGHEFCVVGPGPGMAPLELERRVRETVLLHTPVSTELWPVRISAGGAMLTPWDSGTLDTLLGKADQEMHLRRTLRRESAPMTPRPGSAD